MEINIEMIFVPAVVAAIVAFIGHYVSVRNAKLAADIARESAHLSAKLEAEIKLAEFRQNWIDELREDMSEFQSLGVTPNFDQTKEREFYRLGTRIELRMNPDDENFGELQASMYEFLNATKIEDKYKANPKYVLICQRILKKEWDVLKTDLNKIRSLENV